MCVVSKPFALIAPETKSNLSVNDIFKHLQPRVAAIAQHKAELIGGTNDSISVNSWVAVYGARFTLTRVCESGAHTVIGRNGDIHCGYLSEQMCHSGATEGYSVYRVFIKLWYKIQEVKK